MFGIAPWEAVYNISALPVADGRGRLVRRVQVHVHISQSSPSRSARNGVDFCGLPLLRERCSPGSIRNDAKISAAGAAQKCPDDPNGRRKKSSN